jgi:putative transposase
VLGSIDFTTIEVWTKGGLITYYLLFVMEVATRRVHFAGCTPNPDGPCMKQIARNLTDCEDGFINGKRFLIMDRDTKFTDGFREILVGESVEAVRLPPRSPNLNPHIERFMKSIKDESLSRLILFGENMLRTAVRQYLAHYHMERNHQSLDNRIIQPGDEVSCREGAVQSRDRLGGMLRYYFREAA